MDPMVFLLGEASSHPLGSGSPGGRKAGGGLRGAAPGDPKRAECRWGLEMGIYPLVNIQKTMENP